MPKAKRAMDIEALVHWALAKQNVGYDGGRGIGRELDMLSGGGRTATGSLEAYLAVGTRIDTSKRPIEDPAPLDAILIGEAIERLPGDARILVRVAGRTGSPVDWGQAGSGQWVPVRDRRGNQLKRFSDQRRQRGFLGFEWEWRGLSLEQLEAARCEYWVWWHALEDLRKALEGRLREYIPTGPVRSKEPWNDPKRVLHGIDETAA